MLFRVLLVAVALTSCTKSTPPSPVVDAGSTVGSGAGSSTGADAWLQSVVGPVKLGVSSDASLIAAFGQPRQSWDHGNGLKWFLYAGQPEPLMRRFYSKDGVVTLVHFEGAGDIAFTPERALALLADWNPRDLPVTLKPGDEPGRFIGKCGLPGLPDQGVMFLYSQGRLLEASISPWAAWKFSAQVCGPQ